MINISDLTTAINNFKAIVAQVAITPTSLGTLLQNIVNSLGTALSDSDKVELAEAIRDATGIASSADEAIKILVAKIGAKNGIATLDDNGKLTSSQFPNNISTGSVITSRITTPEFNDDPLTGYGFGMYESDGSSYNVVDYLTVRKGMRVAVLEIAEYKAANGGFILSKANGTIKSVEEDEFYFVCGLEKENQFKAGDLVRCQRFNTDNGNFVMYWVKVVEVSDNPARIKLNVSDFSDINTTPREGDVLVLMGSASDTTRQGFTVITEEGIAVYDGVNTTEIKASNLKAKMGDLSGITWKSRNLSGHGFVGNSVYLDGEFVLSSGKSVAEAITEAENGAVSTARTYTDTQITATAESFTSQISKVTRTIQAGNINFVRQTNKGVTGWTGYNASGFAYTINPYSENSDFVCFKYSALNEIRNLAQYTFPFVRKIVKGQKYTLSFDILYPKDIVSDGEITMDAQPSQTLHLDFVPNDGTKNIYCFEGNLTLNPSNDWQHISLTATAYENAPENITAQIRIYFNSYTPLMAVFGNLKMEEGEINTAYTKAPEDSDDSFSEVRSEIKQTAEEIEMKVSVTQEELVTGEAIVTTDLSDNPRTNASNGYFYYEPNNTYFPCSILEVGKEYTLQIDIDLPLRATTLSAFINGWTDARGFTIPADKKGIGRTTLFFNFTLSAVTATAQWIALQIRGNNFTADDVTTLYGMKIVEGTTTRKSLKETGIDLQDGIITFKSDNVVVKNNAGNTTALLDSDGKLTTSLIVAEALNINHLIAKDSDNFVKATVNANFIGDKLVTTNDGAYRIFYPSDGTQNTQVKLELLDVERVSDGATYTTTLRMFDTDGSIAWELGTDALTKGFTSPDFVMVDLANSVTNDDEAKQETIFESTKYGWNSKTGIILGAVTGKTYYEADYSSSKTAGEGEKMLLEGYTRHYRRKWTYNETARNWEVSTLTWDVETTTERN